MEGDRESGGGEVWDGRNEEGESECGDVEWGEGKKSLCERGGG